MRQCTELAAAVVEPTTILGPAVIANVNVWSAVAIQIAKDNGQALVPWCLREWLSRLVEEDAARPGKRGERPFPVIQIERVRFSQFVEHTVNDFDARRVATAGNWL